MKSTSKTAAAKINGRITVTEDVHVVPASQPWFPLIDRAHYANRTLSGIESNSQKDQGGDAGTPTGDAAEDADVRTDDIIPDDDEDIVLEDENGAQGAQDSERGHDPEGSMSLHCDLASGGRTGQKTALKTL